MTRFPPIPKEQWSEEQRTVAARISGGPRGEVRGPFVAMLHSPGLAGGVEQLGEYLRFHSPLPKDLVEFAILMTGYRWSVRRILYSHSKLAQEAGLAQDIIDDVIAGRRPKAMSADATIVFEFCTELLRDQQVSDPTFERAAARWGRHAVMDLIGLCGYYTMVGMVLNVAQPPGGPDPSPAPNAAS
jgi:4-carboxymuconolactone decarboxylase